MKMPQANELQFATEEGANRATKEKKEGATCLAQLGERGPKTEVSWSL